MAYSAALRCFEATATDVPSTDNQASFALNMGKGLSELTVSVAADIQNLRSQLTALRKELDDLKAERRRVVL